MRFGIIIYLMSLSSHYANPVINLCGQVIATGTFLKRSCARWQILLCVLRRSRVTVAWCQPVLDE